jgi:hypothetical protein
MANGNNSSTGNNGSVSNNGSINGTGHQYSNSNEGLSGGGSCCRKGIFGNCSCYYFIMIIFN